MRRPGNAQDGLARLPAPAPAALEVSERLRTLILTEIEAAGGAIDFARYMELALYTPGLGYYANGLQKFGAAGDFVTAPEVSPLFGRCLARQCAEVLGALDDGRILELGAGSGALAADLLTELDALGSPPAEYLILELSAELRARQRATLMARCPALLERVRWLDGLPVAGLRGCIVANEVLDAMPVQVFERGAERVAERVVVRDDEGLAWGQRGVTAALAEAVAAIEADLGQPLPGGYRSEVNLRLAPWLRALADSLITGAVLLIDYGYPRREYYLPERAMGTLLCHYRHRVHADPFLWPGLQDITANVDFTAVAEAALAAGLQVAGFTTQAQFLLATGLDGLLGASDPQDPVRHLALVQQAKTLILPDEMGERFKVIALSREWDRPLAGFALTDQRRRL